MEPDIRDFEICSNSLIIVNVFFVVGEYVAAKISKSDLGTSCKKFTYRLLLLLLLLLLVAVVGLLVVIEVVIVVTFVVVMSEI
jgi:hypothetical protein